jgi:CheY-like chemotaxis protein
VEHPLIVVADNDGDILKLLSARLARRGYEVVAVADGESALEAVRERAPSAVVLDWAMPGLEGPEVCARLRSDPTTASIPVVMLSASAMREDGAGPGARRRRLPDEAVRDRRARRAAQAPDRGLPLTYT